MEKLAEVWKILTEAVGRGQYFPGRGHNFFLYGPTSKPVNNLFIIFLVGIVEFTSTDSERCSQNKQSSDRGQIQEIT